MRKPLALSEGRAMQVDQLIEVARRDAELLGLESPAGMVRDVLRLCFASDAARGVVVEHAARCLDHSDMAALLQLGLPEAPPQPLAEARRPAFAALLKAFRVPTDAAERKRLAVLHRHAWLRDAARIAKRDWALCCRERGLRWAPEKRHDLLLIVRFPGVLELSGAQSAALVARSLPGQLDQLDAERDPG
jgi:hypothetical protein